MAEKKQIISKGIAYGKVEFLKTRVNTFLNENNDIDEISKFRSAVKKATKKIKNHIEDIDKNNDNRISDIFLSHKYIINDPIVLEDTEKYILEGEKALEAYSIVIKEVLNKFKKIDNEYMLGRIVDIIDASDRVKQELKNEELLYSLDFDEPTILILEELKPSVVYNLNNKNIVGFITKKGNFNQHSGIIARTLNIPGIVCENAEEKITETDKVLIDCFKGNVYINPNKKTIKKIMEESR
ncbi:PEP-utilizing enzyme [Candidatus Izemoplasma sp. B36]|uniref:PEP-utilizing enzyme n=1 Tax=Candidatus Izemoplasma sp. B36 TaxID=3242468 RepID=UPI0035584AF1